MKASDHCYQTMFIPIWVFLFLSNYPSIEAKRNCTCNLASNNGIQCKCFQIELAQFQDIPSSYSNLCSQRVETWIFQNIPLLVNLNVSNIGDCNVSTIKSIYLNQTGLHRLSDLAQFRSLGTLVIADNYNLTTYNGQLFKSIGKHLKNLKLLSNPVRSLTRSTFNGLVALEHLDLTANRIGHIEQATFNQNCCQAIRELILRHNLLTDLDGENFKGLVNLEVLDLHDNPLQYLAENSFQYFANTLTHLYMSHSDVVPFGGIPNIPLSLLHNLETLRVLHMEELKITNLTNQHFVNLTSLEILSFRGNRLSKLDSNIFQSLINLKHLDLSSNQLVCIPSALNPYAEHDFLAGLSDLEWIDLSTNRLTHLNHLTVRSLGLFERTIGSEKRSRLVLKLDSNPWRHIDEDSFCNPNFLSTMRPVDLIFGPPLNSTFISWRLSPGYWYSRLQWPDGPLALIGPSSRVIGLALNPMKSSRFVNLTAEETRRLGYMDALMGDPDGYIRCGEMMNSGEVSNNRSMIGRLFEYKTPSASAIAFSIASYCPKLPIYELTEKEVTFLGIKDLLNTMDTPNLKMSLKQPQSRLYLLVIVGICIAFLLIALTVIMCYRAWSKQSNQKYPPPLQSANNLDQETDLYQPVEKQKLLTQLNQMDGSADVESNLISNGGTHKLSNHHPLAAATRVNHVRTSRPKSDSEAIGEDIHELTAFGVV